MLPFAALRRNPYLPEHTHPITSPNIAGLAKTPLNNRVWERTGIAKTPRNNRARERTRNKENQPINNLEERLFDSRLEQSNAIARRLPGPNSSPQNRTPTQRDPEAVFSGACCLSLPWHAAGLICPDGWKGGRRRRKWSTGPHGGCCGLKMFTNPRRTILRPTPPMIFDSSLLLLRAQSVMLVLCTTMLCTGATDSRHRDSSPYPELQSCQISHGARSIL